MNRILELESAIKINKENIKSLQKDNNKLKNLINKERRDLVDFYIAKQAMMKEFDIAETMQSFNFNKLKECPDCIDESGICNKCRHE